MNLEDVAPDQIHHTTPATLEGAAMPHKAVVWPPEQVPVEIFELITSYLSRAEVKTLRLVCQEFESKVSAKYFKNVVVPFRSELYGTLSRDEFGARKHPSSTLLSNGMRIFESFGPHILRFALSLELNEDALAHPPIKPTQAAVPSFWGIYRWPHEFYNRYADLESIEQTADEMEGMKEALQCLTKVTNLGLCCDAGLGFLVHPDVTARTAKVEQPVFSIQNWRREQRTSTPLNGDNDIITIADFNGLQAPRRRSSSGDQLALKKTILQKMVVDAGFMDHELDEAINMILETEGTDLQSIDFDERPITLFRNEGRRDHHLRELELDGGWRVFGAMDAEADRSDLRRWPLVPASLTRAQKELLLELEWAHRAMIQSYVIAMIDNASMGSFNNLTTLTIAKIPSSHVHILYRPALWSSFPNLSNVSLGVIPDWRRITKPAPGCIEDESVSPLEAVSKTYKLLQNYIGKQPQIESLHFEWICGGEFAPSSFQRNQYILPAPFVEDADRMPMHNAANLGEEKLLKLPYIKHLSLKNCWASPHVMLQTIRLMALGSLEKLEFETVSLSGQPTPVPQFPIFHQHMPQFPVGINAGPGLNHPWAVNGILGVAHPPPVGHGALLQEIPDAVEDHPVMEVDDGQPPETVDHASLPEWLTWAGFLEHFSPGGNFRKMMQAQDPDGPEPSRDWALRVDAVAPYVPRANRLISDEHRYKLKCLSFKSCGYVHVESLQTNTRALLPPTAQGLVPPANLALLPSRLMQRCRDRMLGTIIPYMRPQETHNLTTAYHMEMGWTSVYDSKVIEAAMNDGVDVPGVGRFSGQMEAGDTSNRTSHMSAPDGSANAVGVTMAG